MSSDDDDDDDDSHDSVFSEEHKEEVEADAEADDESSDCDGNPPSTSGNPRSAIQHKVTQMDFNDARLYTPDESDATTGSTDGSMSERSMSRSFEGDGTWDKIPLCPNWKRLYSYLPPNGDGAVSDSELYVRFKAEENSSVFHCASDPCISYNKNYCCFPCGVQGLFTRNVNAHLY